jgi:hypothetical protein
MLNVGDLARAKLSPSALSCGSCVRATSRCRFSPGLRGDLTALARVTMYFAIDNACGKMIKRETD